MLDGGGPDHVLKRTTSRVHIETIILQYLRGQLIIMGFLDERVLRSLKSVSLSGGNPFLPPTCGWVEASKSATSIPNFIKEAESPLLAMACPF